MLAGENALHHYCPKIQGKVVQVKCDNSTVVHYLKNQGGTKSFSLCDMALRILNWCLVNRVTLLPLSMKGEYSLIPDAFSRQKILQDWHLRPNIARRIFLRHGLPQIDLFATKLSSQCPLYMTWDAADTEAVATDALRQPWTYNLVYAFPLIPLIPLVLKKLEQFPSLKMLLVAPAWPPKPWFPSLLNLVYSQPLRLPYRKDLVIDLSTNKAHPNIRNLNLTVWPITGNQSVKLIFQKKHFPLFPAVGGQELYQGITHAGISGQTGARNEVWTQLPFL